MGFASGLFSTYVSHTGRFSFSRERHVNPANHIRGPRGKEKERGGRKKSGGGARDRPGVAFVPGALYDFGRVLAGFLDDELDDV